MFGGLLRAQQPGRGDFPRVVPQRPGGRLHGPIQQQEPLLPRPAVQRQPQLHHRAHAQAHRQRYVGLRAAMPNVCMCICLCNNNNDNNKPYLYIAHLINVTK